MPERKKPAWADKVDAVGRLVILVPETQADGTPSLREGEVYVTTRGLQFHPVWCHVIADRWAKSGARSVHVTRLSDVGQRQECRLPPAPSPRPAGLELERAEWRRLSGELSTQARGIADRLLAQGPGAIERLGPQMERYAATKREFEALMLRVAGTTNPDKAPDW